MKAFLLLLLCPLLTWGQADTLKPIGTELIPIYTGEHGPNVGTQYTYDGLDVRRPKELGRHIMASGDPQAMQAFERYISSRKAGGWMIAAGLVSTAIGLPIMASNRPNTDGRFTITQPLQCPKGYICSGSSIIQVPDKPRERAFSTGAAMTVVGLVVAGIGWGLNMPGRNLRSSVQYYNRALKQRGISWQVAPYSTVNTTGGTLIGTF